MDLPGKCYISLSRNLYPPLHHSAQSEIDTSPQGLRDLNAARRNITERYLLSCDGIFVVCQIGRAVTDEGVMAVTELARQANLSNVSIICTKSDVSVSRVLSKLPCSSCLEKPGTLT